MSKYTCLNYYRCVTLILIILTNIFYDIATQGVFSNMPKPLIYYLLGLKSKNFKS